MKKPVVNTFLIGAPKSGTTTLSAYFEAHPQIFMPAIKEPNYFATDIRTEDFSSTYKNWVAFDAEAFFQKRHPEKVQTAFLNRPEHYDKLFENASEPLVADCSTSYMFSQQAAKNIFEYNPQAKVIAVLRHPAERAFSHYLMALRYGLVRTDFETAWRDDLTFEPKKWGRAELFAELGQYGSQLARYYHVFPEKQILILRFEELKNAPQKVFDQVCDFLETERFDPGELKAENTGRLPRFRGFYPQRMTRVKESAKKLLPKSWFEGLKNMAYAQKPLPSLPPKMRDELTHFYKDEITLLQKRTKQDFSDWIN